MTRNRWLRYLIAAGLVLVGAVGSAAPAAGAPCNPANCYRYQADITIAGWTLPAIPIPVFPGSTHTYTVLVTNTGWRTGNGTAPTPWAGPDSGPVFVVMTPSSRDDYLIAANGFQCNSYGWPRIACDTPSVPSGATGQFTVTFRAPYTPGTYTIDVWADSFQWTEYSETNNSLTLTYQVGYLA